MVGDSSIGPVSNLLKYKPNAHKHASATHRIHDEEKGYYADGEDAYDMRKYFKKQQQQEEAAGEKKKKQLGAGGPEALAGAVAKMSLENGGGGAKEEEEGEGAVGAVVVEAAEGEEAK